MVNQHMSVTSSRNMTVQPAGGGQADITWTHVLYSRSNLLLYLLVSFISWAVCVALGPEHPLDSQIQEEEEVL